MSCSTFGKSLRKHQITKIVLPSTGMIGLSIQSMYSLIDQWGVSLSAKTIQANKYGSKELHDAEAVDVSKNLLPPAFLSLNG